MKKLLILSAAIILFVNVGISIAQDDPKTMNVPDGKSIIYIIRTRDMSNFGIYRSVNKIDDTELPTLGSRDFVYKVVDPGDHKVVSKGSTKESELAVKTEAGKKYYVIQTVKVWYGAYWTTLVMEKDTKRAEKIIKDCTEAKFKDAK